MVLFSIWFCDSLEIGFKIVDFDGELFLIIVALDLAYSILQLS